MEHVDVLRCMLESGEYDFVASETRAIQCAIAALSAQGEAVAWMASDGRVISAKQKERAIRDGGASASSVSVYSEPLYPQPQPQGTDVAVKRGLATGDTPTLEDVWRHLDPTMWAVVCAAIEEARAKPQGAVVDDAIVRKVAVAINGVGSPHQPNHAWKQLGSNERKFQDKKARAAIAALVAALGEGKS